MKNISLLIVSVLVISLIGPCFAQEGYQPYTARAYWEELNRPEYRSLLEKKLRDEPLTPDEKKWTEQYKQYLDEYYASLSATEKEYYAEHKAEWYLEVNLADLSDKGGVNEKRDNVLLLKHIGFSGLSGTAYGLMINRIFDLDDAASVGVPMIISGGSMLYPVFSKQYDNINNNSLWLRSHGKIAGGIYGYMVAGAIFSDRVSEEYQVSLSLALASSVGLGYLGFQWGKSKNWTEGKVSLYQYYGYTLPMFTSACLFSTGYDELRGYAINVLLSAPLGYLMANKVAGLADYSRGDVTGIVGLTAMGMAFGGSIILFAEPESEAAILFPAIGGVLGAAAGHYMYKDLHLSRPEGRRVNYAMAGGALIGLGATFLADPGEDGWYMLIPAVTGLLGYGAMYWYYNKRDGAVRHSEQSYGMPGLRLQFYPENLIFSRIDTKGYIPPLFSASLTF